MPKKATEKKETAIGTFIEEEAAKKHLSLRAFSMEAGLDEGTLAHIVSGRRQADITVCSKLGEYLMVDPCYLLQLAGRLPLATAEDQQPEWIRNLIYRLSHKSYSKNTIDMVNALLNEADKNSKA